MFSWFLKLLGIEEDKPVSDKNSFLAGDAKKNTDSPTNNVKAEPQKLDTSPKKAEEAIAAKPTVTDTKPAPAPAPAPAPESRSLSEEFPDLKANFVKVLADAGFTTKVAIDKAEDNELLALKGIGKATLKILRS